MANIKFNNLQEIKKYLNKQTEVALKNTLKILKDKLKEFVKEDVYDAYSPKFYERTEWLLQDGVIDYYVGNALNGSYGGVRIKTNKSYPVELEAFQHGNVYTGEFYPENFIAMLNGQIADAIWNPFHFPVLNRVSFLEEFEEWMSENYASIFQEECEKLGIDLNKSNSIIKKVANPINMGGSSNIGKNSSSNSLARAINTNAYSNAYTGSSFSMRELRF